MSTKESTATSEVICSSLGSRPDLVSQYGMTSGLNGVASGLLYDGYINHKSLSINHQGVGSVSLLKALHSLDQVLVEELEAIDITSNVQSDILVHVVRVTLLIKHLRIVFQIADLSSWVVNFLRSPIVGLVKIYNFFASIKSMELEHTNKSNPVIVTACR